MRQIPINHQKRTPVNQNCISKSTETTDIFTMQFLVLLSTSSLKMKKTNKQKHTHKNTEGIYFPQNSNAPWDAQNEIVIENRSISTQPRAVTETCLKILLKRAIFRTRPSCLKLPECLLLTNKLKLLAPHLQLSNKLQSLEVKNT